MPLANALYVILGNIGSDAGYWTVGPDGKLVHHGGWAVEQLAEVQAGLQIMASATRLKSPGVAEGVAKKVSELVGRELGAHLGQLAGQSNAPAVVVVVAA